VSRIKPRRRHRAAGYAVLLLGLLVIGVAYAAKTFTQEQQVSAIVVSYYWHFVDVVWIGLFTTIYLIR